MNIPLALGSIETDLENKRNEQKSKEREKEIVAIKIKESVKN